MTKTNRSHGRDGNVSNKMLVPVILGAKKDNPIKIIIAKDDNAECGTNAEWFISLKNPV